MHIFERTISAGNVKDIKNREGSTAAVDAVHLIFTKTIH
jgi:hypothetical protein